jgi:hypothetical protein
VDRKDVMEYHYKINKFFLIHYFDRSETTIMIITRIDSSKLEYRITLQKEYSRQVYILHDCPLLFFFFFANLYYICQHTIDYVVALVSKL